MIASAPHVPSGLLNRQTIAADQVEPDTFYLYMLREGLFRTVDGGLMSMNVNLGATTESSRLVWCFEHVNIESSTAPYDPAASPWTFEFKKPDVAEAAQQVFADVSPTKPLFTGQFQGFVDRLGDGGPFPITLDDSQASLELVTAWYRSARTGSVEELPLPVDHPDRGSWRPAGFR